MFESDYDPEWVNRTHVSLRDLPCMSEYLTSTLRAYLRVELVVSVPARNRFRTVDTRLSKWNSDAGLSFSCAAD